jgi:rhodanese-related sulfurtransferase
MRIKVIFLILIIFIFSATVVMALGTLRHSHLTNELLNSGIRIVDIRTENEWRETGIVKGSLCLTFFSDDNKYDADAFVAKLKQYVSPNDRIVIICRSGNRSLKVGRFLVQRGFADVTNVIDGIKTAKSAGIALVHYKP